MEIDVVPAATEVARAFLTTPFEQYTVTEGFLLLFFLAGVVWLCIHFFKGGF